MRFAYHQERAFDSDESSSCGVSYRKGNVPYCRIAAYLLLGAFGFTLAWECCFFGNLLKESGVTRRLAENPAAVDYHYFVRLDRRCLTQASEFLAVDSILIFLLGALSFVIATA